MSYRNAALALQGVTDLTADWGTFGNLIQTRPDPGTDGFCYEFTLVRRSAVNVSTAVALAEAVAMGAAVAGYSWDVYGVLLSTGAAGFPVVQVIFQFSDWTIAGDLGAINVAVNDAVVKSGLGDGIGAVSMLRLTAPEARYFSQQGGLAPLVVTENKKVSLTKAAVSPSGKQVMSGDVRNLSAASPLSAVQSVAAAAAEAPWGLVLGFGLLGFGVLFLSGFLKPSLRPNASKRGRRRGLRRKFFLGKEPGPLERHGRRLKGRGGVTTFAWEFANKSAADRFKKWADSKGFDGVVVRRTRLKGAPYVAVAVAPIHPSGKDGDMLAAAGYRMSKASYGLRANASRRRRVRGQLHKFAGKKTITFNIANHGDSASRAKAAFRRAGVRPTTFWVQDFLMIKGSMTHATARKLMRSAVLRRVVSDSELRRNGSDDAQFALRLLKAKEKPGLLDGARYDRGLQELMDAFAYYDQVTESAYQDEPYGEVDDEKYRLGEAYDRYLGDERQEAMKKALGDERSPWDF